VERKSIQFYGGFCNCKMSGVFPVWNENQSILKFCKKEKGASASKSQALDLLLSPVPKLFSLWTMFPLLVLEQEFGCFKAAARMQVRELKENQWQQPTCRNVIDFQAPLHVFFQQADSYATAPTLKRREHSVIRLHLGFIWHRHIPW